MVLLFNYDLQMLPESPVGKDQIEAILSKLMGPFEHCRPLSTCYFLKVLPDHLPMLYEELENIGKTLHDSAIADFHFVMNAVNFDDPSFQYQFLKEKSACVRMLFAPEDMVEDTPEND